MKFSLRNRYWYEWMLILFGVAMIYYPVSAVFSPDPEDQSGLSWLGIAIGLALLWSGTGRRD